MKRYNPKEIEPRWQKSWDAEKTYEVDFASKKPKFIGFGMFNYPSGAGIHIGHGKNFTLPDILVRAKRQQGHEAYMPVGFDSFGLPAENYAIKTGTSPQLTTEKAIENYRTQYRAMGWSMDWSKEIDTSHPDYYRWTQWIFIKLFEHGLAYQKESPQWWCEHDQTVLANEQVEGGKCWRCGNPVVKKNLKQWFYKITEYIDEILEATDALDWTESVKTMQKNWIGKSEGAEITFQLKDYDEKLTVFTTRPDTIYGATFMVLAPENPLVSKIATKLQKAEVDKYVLATQAKSEVERQEQDREKTGLFTGSYAINPATKKEIPIWIADYVLPGYGTGAIMAVPAHDERDYEFARKFDLPIREVVAPDFGAPLPDAVDVTGPVVVGYDPKTKQYMSLINTKNNMRWFVAGGLEEGETYEQAALRELGEEAGFHKVEKLIRLGGPNYSYFYNSNKNSNRRSFSYMYVAIIDSKDQGKQELESHENYTVVWSDVAAIIHDLENEPTGRGHWIDGMARAQVAVTAYENGEEYKAPVYENEGVLFDSGPYGGVSTAEARERIVADLEKKKIAKVVTNFKMRDWLISRQRYWGAPIPIIHCPDCGAVAVPEDQLPVLLPEVENYKPTGGNTSVLATVEDWVNVDCPKCHGPAKRETDTQDGYACSSWYFLRYLDPHNDKQAWDPGIADKWMPIDFYNGGDHATAHLLYARFFMRFFHKLGLVNTPEPFKKMYYHAKIVAADGQAFSKTLGNGPDPLKLIGDGYGADSVRTYICFMAPADMESPWSDEGVPGCFRFLSRLWTVTQEFLESDSAKTASSANEPSKSLLKITHKTIKKVTEDIEQIKYNTAIAAMMECVNELYKLKVSEGFDNKTDWQFALESLAQIVAPFAPHMAEELWHDLGHNDTVHSDHWPMWEDKYLAEDTMRIAVQVNGKLRGVITVKTGVDKEAVIKAATGEEKVKAYLTSEPKNTIYVPGKLVNFVL